MCTMENDKTKLAAFCDSNKDRHDERRDGDSCLIYCLGF